MIVLLKTYPILKKKKKSREKGEKIEKR